LNLSKEKTRTMRRADLPSKSPSTRRLMAAKAAEKTLRSFAQHEESLLAFNEAEHASLAT
jgi:hypothetical protein